MSYPNELQRTQIQQLLDDVRNSSSQNVGKYHLVYQLILDQITEVNSEGDEYPISGVELGSWLWLKGAVQVNSGEGSFSDWIREYTSVQVENRLGADSVPTNEEMNWISDQIAERVIESFIQNDERPIKLEIIGTQDAGAVIGSIFSDKEDYSSWSGVPLFLAFGYGDFFDHILDGKNGTYDYLSLINASTKATEFAYGVGSFADLASASLQVRQTISMSGWDLVGNLSLEKYAAADSFMQEYYNSDFTALPISYNMVLGLLYETDTQITGSTSNDFIHAGYGGASDTILASNGADFIDGGDGIDYVVYDSFRTEVSVGGGAQYSFADGTYLVISKEFDWVDKVFNVEHIVLGTHDDVVNINGLAESNVLIDMGQGNDTVDFSDMYNGNSAYNNHFITFAEDGRVHFGASAIFNYEKVKLSNLADSVVAKTSIDLHIDGQEGDDKITAGSGNDTLIGGAGRDYLFGAGGNDTIFFSRDGDSAGGGVGNDIFVFDTLYEIGQSCSISGGQGYDIVYLPHAFADGQMLSLFTYGRMNGVSFSGIEELRFGWNAPDSSHSSWWSDSSAYTLTLADFADEYFSKSNAEINSRLGVVEQVNRDFADIGKCTIVEGSNDRVMFVGTLDNQYGVPFRGTIDSVTAVAQLPNGTTFNPLVQWSGHTITLTMPSGISIDMDSEGLVGLNLRSQLNISYHYIEEDSDGNPVVVNREMTAYTGTGIVNQYDQGLTELIVPQEVLGSNSGFMFDVVHDSTEHNNSVYFELVDDHNGIFTIDAASGRVHAKQGLLFTDNRTVTLDVKASDNFTTVSKTVNIGFNSTVETPPVIDLYLIPDAVASQGQTVGYLYVHDDNQIGGLADLEINLEVLGADPSLSDLLHLDLATGVLSLSRDPLPSELSGTLQIKITAGDVTEQFSEHVAQLVFEPWELTINGTSGNDYLSSTAGPDRPAIINGLGGDDLLIAQFANTKLFGGDDNDELYLAPGSYAEGGSGNDFFASYSGNGVMTGGEGSDQFSLSGGGNRIIYTSLFDSPISISEDGEIEVWDQWDVIQGFSDTDIIDLSALGPLEWSDSSVNSDSILATMVDVDGSIILGLDGDRDGTFDFAVEFQNIQANHAIKILGLSDWEMV